MKRRNSFAALMVTASLFGCTTSSAPGVSVTLVATRQNTGQIGNVALADWDKQTGFSFFISGVPSGAALPLRIYTFINKGSCEQPVPRRVRLLMTRSIPSANLFAAGRSQEACLWHCRSCCPVSTPSSFEVHRTVATSIFFAEIRQTGSGK